jgi:uncharacterized protein YdeI (YjbR/CyaY-like superfamily)
MEMNPKVDGFLGKAKQWREEMEALRAILMDCALTEELKWGKPCYAFEGTNIAILQPFKEYCALLFFKGALLADPKGLLVKTGPNTVAGRQLRFTSVREIVRIKAAVKSLIREAIAAEKAGLKVERNKNTELVLAEELQKKLDAQPALKIAFSALTPGRQRAYNLYFSAPKQSKTREARIEKCVPRILKGLGMLDR